MATALASNAQRRNHNDPKYRTGAAEATEWAVGRVADEAHCLFEWMQRNGRTVEEMVNLIAVTDAEYKQLCLWAESHPAIALKLDGMMEFRDAVLRAFRVLVELHEANGLPAGGALP